LCTFCPMATMLQNAFESLIAHQKPEKEWQPERILITKSGVAFDVVSNPASKFKPAESKRRSPTFVRSHSQDIDEVHDEVDSRRLQVVQSRMKAALLQLEQSMAARAWLKSIGGKSSDIEKRPAFPRNQQAYTDSINYKLPVQLMIYRACEEKRNLLRAIEQKWSKDRRQMDESRAKEFLSSIDRQLKAARQALLQPSNPEQLIKLLQEMSNLVKSFEQFVEKPSEKSGRSSRVTSPSLSASKAKKSSAISPRK